VGEGITGDGVVDVTVGDSMIGVTVTSGIADLPLFLERKRTNPTSNKIKNPRRMKITRSELPEDPLCSAILSHPFKSVLMDVPSSVHISRHTSSSQAREPVRSVVGG
jgi:hypothetical protein